MKSILNVLALGVMGCALIGCGASEEVAEDVAKGTEEVTATLGEATTVSADAPVNQHCPMMDGHDVNAEVTVSWNGKKVAFCCEACIEPWNELSDDDKAAKLTAASAPHAEGEPATTEAHDHGA